MRDVYPFLYDLLLDRLLHGDVSLPRVLIGGGRGLGKTSFFQRLVKEIGPRNARILSGKSPGAEGEFIDWASVPKSVLLVDDFERLFNPRVEKALLSLPEEIGAWRLILAAGDLRAIEDKTDWGGSPALNTFHRERLDPWEGNWEDRLEGAVRDALDRIHADGNIDEEGEEYLERLLRGDEEVLDAWIAQFIKVTSGHPALVEGAFRSWHQLLVGYPKLPERHLKLLKPPARGRKGGWRQSIQLFLEDALTEPGSGLDVIAQAVRYLQAKSASQFEMLARLARAGDDASPIKDATVRYALRESGLAHLDSEDGTLVITGDLVRQQILAVTGARPVGFNATVTVEVVSVRLETAEGAVDDQGTIIGRLSDDEELSVKVYGVSWRVLWCLACHGNGEPVSVTRIKQDAELASDSAARSAIKRLTKLLASKGLTGIPKNVSGRGYYLPIENSNKGTSA